MRFGLRFLPVILVGLSIAVFPSCALAQTTTAAQVTAGELPEAPQPSAMAAGPDSAEQSADSGGPQIAPAAVRSAGAESSEAQGKISEIAPLGRQAGAQPNGQGVDQHQTAEEQIKEQEQQRVLGVVPSFNVSYRSDAVSLTGPQKVRLAFRTTTDPFTIGAAVLTAGYHEARNDVSGLPWGPGGFAERSGLAYLDVFSGTMIGNGVLPALLHQDPRFFRMGHGSVGRRIIYAAATSVMCKHDNTHKWEPNYSNVLGNIASGGLSTLYYPSSNSGAGLVFSTAMIETAEGSIAAIFQEFWPDISRKLFHKDPTHGLDAQGIH